MRKAIVFINFFVIIAIFLGSESIVFAHCDTLEGPVVKDAEVALKTKNVFPVLKWVPQKYEKKVRLAFDKALKKRLKNKETANMEFFELLVRIHREGEGEPFTGIKPAGTLPEPAVIAADEAIENKSVDSLIENISNKLSQEIRKRFNHVIETEKHVNESVELGREYVAAYVEFVHYVEQIHNSIEGTSTHH